MVVGVNSLVVRGVLKTLHQFVTSTFLFAFTHLQDLWASVNNAFLVCGGFTVTKSAVLLAERRITVRSVLNLKGYALLAKMDFGDNWTARYHALMFVVSDIQ